jgi:uncharacterized protein DUF1579
MTARSITAAFVAAAFAAVAPSAFAQGAMAHPKPAAEMSGLKVFDGSWTCSGQGAMEPGGPMMKMDSSVKSHSDLGGFWQSGTVKGAPMAGMPAFEGMFHMTWDPAAKQYLMLFVDNMGGRSEERAPGWVGDTLVFTGEGQMGGQKMGMRDTFTRKADGSLGHAGEVQVKGQWVKMMDETCRKSAAK